MPAVEPDNHTPWGAPPPAGATPLAPPAPRVNPQLPPPPLPHQSPPAPQPPPHLGYTPPPYQTASPQHPAAPPSAGSFPDQPSSQLNRVATIGKRLFLVSCAVLMALVGLAIARSLDKSWDPVLEPYIAFVEAERGLEFTEPVNLRWADIAAEIEADRPVGQAGSDEVDPWSEAYRLLGLIDPNPEVSNEQAVNDTLSENAGAFYEPWSETIVLPEGGNELALSVTIVHELTHALQHQHGMLGGSGLFDTADDEVARRALIEGDAERIALAWYWAQPESFRDDYLNAIGYDPDVEQPDPGDSFLVSSFYASYEIGTPMVQAIVEAQGQEAIDELLRSKNVGTTERLVDVLGEDQRSTIDAIEEMSVPQSSEGAVGDLGALTWFHALAPTVGTGDAFDALIGYDDDAFALYEEAGQSCVRYSVFFESDADANQFVDLLDAAALGGARSLSGKEVRMDVCDPIGNPGDQRFGTILPLIVAHEAAVAYLMDGYTADVARCAAIAQASTIPADQAVTDFVGWDVLIDEKAQFLADCQ